jgi:hypothetical protein
MHLSQNIPMRKAVLLALLTLTGFPYARSTPGAAKESQMQVIDTQSAGDKPG